MIRIFLLHHSIVEGFVSNDCINIEKQFIISRRYENLIIPHTYLEFRIFMGGEVLIKKEKKEKKRKGKKRKEREFRIYNDDFPKCLYWQITGPTLSIPFHVLPRTVLFTTAPCRLSASGSRVARVVTQL